MAEQTRDRELASFKTEISLVDFACEAFGYAPDQRIGSASPRSLRLKGSSDKIVVARDQDQHWVYFSVHDDRDNGSIIDFLLNRGRSFDQIRRELRPWLGSHGAKVARQRGLPTLVGSSREVRRSLANFETAATVDAHPYLTSRSLGGDILGHPRFVGCVRRDQRGNALFPHEDDAGLSGFEIKNRGFTGFSAGGVKTLWLSNRLEDDHELVLAESAIDALSHWALHRPDHAIYASTGGGWSPETGRRLCELVLSLPEERRRLILAFDQDEQGRRYADKAEQLLEGTKVAIIQDFPVLEGLDWNDVLRQRGAVEKGKGRGTPPRKTLQEATGSPENDESPPKAPDHLEGR
jgi:hypothetical protein